MNTTTTTKIKAPDKSLMPDMQPGSPEKASKDAGGTGSKLYHIPVDSIKLIPGFNVRVESDDYIDHRDELVNLIRENGFDEGKPLIGYVAEEKGANVIYVTDGHTRLDAVRTINADPDTKTEDEIKTLPVIVRREAPSMADLTVALHTSNTGRPLTPYELGVVVKRLLTEEDADKDDIARRLSVTPRYIDDVLLLADAPVKVRAHILAGEISSTMAVQELRRDPKEAAARIKTAVDKAQGKGKKRATAKDIGPKLKRTTQTVEVPAGSNIKEIVKQVAAMVRDAFPVEGTGDDRVTVRVGEVKLVLGIEQEPKPKKAPAAKKAPAKKAPAAKPAEPVADKPKRRKAADKPVPAAAEAETDLGIPGAVDAENDLPPMPKTVAAEAPADEVDI